MSNLIDKNIQSLLNVSSNTTALQPFLVLVFSQSDFVRFSMFSVAKTASFILRSILFCLSVSFINILLAQFASAESSTTSLASAKANSDLGELITYTATVSSVTQATGSVVFKDGVRTLGTSALSIVLGTPTATLRTNDLTVGVHSLTATYSGDGTVATSTSSAISQTVNKAGATVTVLTSPSPSAIGENVSLTASVVPTAGTPGGTITFRDNGTSLGTASLSAQSPTLARIAADYGQTCAVTSAGGVNCWGNNSFGQLGDKSTDDRLAPVEVFGLTSGFASVAAGAFHSCAVTTAGGAKCWGENSSAQLGTNSTTNSLFPVDVSGLTSGVAAVEAGDAHTCALTTTGGVKCWGINNNGRLGDGTFTSRNAPVNVKNLTSGVVAIAVGSNHSCALTSTGGVKCWGYNGFGQLGIATSTTVSSTPVDVTNLTSGVAAIAAGDDVTCALTTAGGVKCWGRNGSGSLGNNSTTNSSTPVDVDSLSSGVSAIAVGGAFGTSHVCALTTSGGVKCWGSNVNGEVGISNSTTMSLVPVDVTNLSSGAMAIAAGAYHSCALKNTGSALCWGSSSNGRLGDGGNTSRSTPGLVTGLSAAGNPATASLSVSTLSAGNHSITADYGGDDNLNSASSSAVVHVVSKATASVTLTTSNNSVGVGTSITLTAAVTASSGTPSGTVTFMDGSTSLGDASLVSGSASLSLTSLSAGTHTLTAVYGGSSNHAGATSAAISQTVSKLASAIIASASPTKALPLGPVTVNVTVVAADSSTPTGSVSVTEGSDTLGTATLVAGEASITFSTLSSGDHNLTVSYGGSDKLLARSTIISVAISPLSGAAYKVSTSKKGDQSAPAIARLTKGGFVTVWNSAERNIGGLGVFGQIFSAPGKRLGKEFQLNTSPTKYQSVPAVAGLPSGDFVAVWIDKDSLLIGRLFDKTGKAKGDEFLIDGSDKNYRTDTGVAALGSGGFAVSWTTQETKGEIWKIMLRFFDKAGEAKSDSQRVDSGKSRSVLSTAITSLKSGGVALSWTESSKITSPVDIMLRGYSGAGKALSAPVVASQNSKPQKAAPTIASLADGSLVLAWASIGQDGSESGIVARAFKNATGTKLTDEFIVPNVTDGQQTEPAIAPFAKGGFMIAWTSSDGSKNGIFARRFTAKAVPGDGSVRVNSQTKGDQKEPALVASSDRSITAVWSSTYLDGSGFAIAGQTMALGAAAN